eukprot:8682520-Karenia_brevis.AAC.1
MQVQIQINNCNTRSKFWTTSPDQNQEMQVQSKMKNWKDQIKIQKCKSRSKSTTAIPEQNLGLQVQIKIKMLSQDQNQENAGPDQKSRAGKTRSKFRSASPGQNQ